MDEDRTADQHAEDEEPEGEVSESGSGNDVNTPFSPDQHDDSALGDSDQHSTA